MPDYYVVEIVIALSIALLVTVASRAKAETCIASQYGIGDGYHGKRAADGSIFNTYAMTAAHKTLRFGTQVTVTNLNTGKSVSVRITDRGPFVRGRCIDLSRAAANAIGMDGTAPVSVQ